MGSAATSRASATWSTAVDTVAGSKPLGSVYVVSVMPSDVAVAFISSTKPSTEPETALVNGSACSSHAFSSSSSALTTRPSQCMKTESTADAARRSQDQDPGAEPGVHDPAADRVAGDLGHVAVEHGHVVAVDAEPLQDPRAVVADVDGHRELAQALRHRVGEQPLVVGKEDTQGSPLPGRDIGVDDRPPTISAP